MKRRGNPNWGKPLPQSHVWVPHQLTQFERIVIELGLRNDQDMLRSEKLRVWVKKHFNTRYVPEWYLKHWGLEPNDKFAGF